MQLTQVKQLNEAEKLKRAVAATMAAIAKKIPQTPTRSDIDLVKDNIPHLAEVAENLTDAISVQDLIYPFLGLVYFYQQFSF